MPNESDRLQLPASEAAIAAPSANVALQSDTTAAIQPIPLSLTDLLQALLNQQDGELLLSQVEATVSKPRFQQAFPQLGQIDRAHLIAAFRQLEAAGAGEIDFLKTGQAVLKYKPASLPTTASTSEYPFLSKPAQCILEKVKSKNVEHEWLDARWVKNYVFYTKTLRQFSPDQIRDFLRELAAAGAGVVEGEGGALKWCFAPNSATSTQN